MKRVLLFLFFMPFLYNQPLLAQDNPDADLDSLANILATEKPSDLQNKLNRGIETASKDALPLRETPGIISVITEAQIKKMGARDLKDVLSFMPGFEFSSDVEFFNAPTIRGNYASEGKTLLLIDGQEFNELLYRTVPYGNHIPVGNIERIEVIRGPGSAIYGGAAAYAVVNVITKTGEGIDGASIVGAYSQMGSIMGRAYTEFAIGTKVKDWDLKASFFTGAGTMTDQNYLERWVEPVIDANGDTTGYAQNEYTYDLSNPDYARADPLQFVVALQGKGLKARYMHDRYTNASHNYLVNHTYNFLDFQYDWEATDNLKITPRISYTNQTPWEYPADFVTPSEFPFLFEVQTSRLTANLTGVWDVSRNVNLVFGGEHFREKGVDKLKAGWFEGNEISYINTAVFGQLLVKHRLANLTIGARYDNHSAYDPVFVPRIGLTKRIEDFHFKILYSKSFRAPSIMNISFAENGAGTIKPEKSDVFELELGYQFTPNMLLAANVFSIATKDPILYFYDYDTEVNLYFNEKKTGTKGIELVYSYLGKWGSININYAYYRGLNSLDAPSFEIPGQEGVLASASPHKFNIISSFNITSKFSINPSFRYGSKRYSHVGTDLDYVSTVEASDAYGVFNLNLRYENLLINGLSIDFGVFDLFNSRPNLLLGYDTEGFYFPLPGPSREVMLKIRYNLNFNKK